MCYIFFTLVRPAMLPLFWRPYCNNDISSSKLIFTRIYALSNGLVRVCHATFPQAENKALVKLGKGADLNLANLYLMLDAGLFFLKKNPKDNGAHEDVFFNCRCTMNSKRIQLKLPGFVCRI